MGERSASGVPPWGLNRDFGTPVGAITTVASFGEFRVVDDGVFANDVTVFPVKYNVRFRRAQGRKEMGKMSVLIHADPFGFSDSQRPNS